MELTFAGGDRDCSSGVISSYQAAGLEVGATYTGDMVSGFTDTGLFEVWGMGETAERGDIYLNEASHTAMCLGASHGYDDALGEFYLNENGGIVGGEVGDQTGGESRVTAYYDFPWDCILHCTDRALAEKAAAVMEHLCDCPNHGYTQGSGRWGDGTFESIDYDEGDDDEMVDYNELANAVWNFEQNGTLMRDRVQGTDEAANAAREQLTRTDDVSGRDTVAALYDRVCYLGARTAEMEDKLDQILNRLG